MTCTKSGNPPCSYC